MSIFNINLNIHYSMPQDLWDKVSILYSEMTYWKGFIDGVPHWYSCDDSTDDKLISASVESSGLQFYVRLPQGEWEEWLAMFKNKVSEILGYEIGEPEDGYEFSNYD